MASSLSAASSSSVKLPDSLLISSNAPNSLPPRPRSGTQSSVRVSKPSFWSTLRSISCWPKSRSTRRGCPEWITCPTIPVSSGIRNSPPSTPNAGRPTSVFVSRSHRNTLARSAASSRVDASAICSSSVSRFQRLTPLRQDLQDRFQPFDRGAAAAVAAPWPPLPSRSRTPTACWPRSARHSGRCVAFKTSNCAGPDRRARGAAIQWPSVPGSLRIQSV